MHRQLSIRAVAVSVLLTLAACGDAAPAAQEQDGPPPLAAAPFSLWLSTNHVTDREPVELIAAIVNHSGDDATFGVGASIDRWNGETWVPHRQLAMCLDHWNCTGEPRPLGQQMAIQDIGLSARFRSAGPPERFTTKGLDPGWYRISQRANETFVAAAILRIDGDGGTVAPLNPLGQPAISIAPVLVAPAGATVQLSALVPPINGGQTLSDIERAVAGLSETAALEHWDGRDWKPIGTISLQPPASNPLGRTAEVPALAEGEYRLVRTGPNGAHTGRFWVTSDAA